MPEHNEQGWVVTIAARERAGKSRPKERLVRVQSRRVDRADAEREAAYTYLHDVESWLTVESVEVAGAVPVIPGPRLPLD